MIKAGPTWNTRGDDWDHKGRSDISQIFISRSENRIKFIHFLYVEDQGNRLVLSQKIGGGGTQSLDTITLDYPSEFITRVSGKYNYRWFSKFLRSFTLETNKRTYGPYQAGTPSCWYKEIEFNYEVEGKFWGFFGTHRKLKFCGLFGDKRDGIESIGIYIKPAENLNQNRISYIT
ncbi:inactive protein RESTRICTED TEV MOVEMENT 1-like [Heracleum sosnowskyi]|uniref:Inactive protein RESTRICTED TEV MOVEMENT 1-like n=1 Tax=Heracleum sosnowskyi TaxID=360622 RepID=A0AAD8GMI6_9APIA|nr:inactive protein RESTRICTED TEV MOVEMENT 1-like [Heracleum sosnowskyi]